MESATLDFPTIDDAALASVSASATPFPKTEVAAAANGALDLEKLDLGKLALAKFAPIRKQLADATKTLTGAVHDLSTQAKVDDAKSLRQRLINAPLADARKVAKGLKSKLKSVSEEVGGELESIEADFGKTALLITPQIEAREAELAAEKAEREAKAAARRQVFEDKIAGIRGYLAMAQGLPSVRVEKGVQFLAKMEIGEEWEEFKPIAEKARDETLASLRTLLAKVQADEAAAEERARIAAENERLRLENERLLVEQRAEAARLKAEADALAAERAELARQREEIAAAQRATAPAQASPPAVAHNQDDLLAPAGGIRYEASLEPAVLAAAPAPSTWATDPEGQQRMLDESRGRFLAGELAKAEEDRRITGTGWLSATVNPAIDAIDVVHVPMIDALADPVEEGAAPAPADLPALLAHIAKAFDTRFPSQPKPSVEWWAELKRLAAEVAA